MQIAGNSHILPVHSPVPIVEIEGGSLWTDSELNQYVFNKSGKVLRDLCTCVNPERANDFNAGSSIFIPPSILGLHDLPEEPNMPYFRGRIVNLTCFNVAAISYGHWLTDVLPRLALYLKQYKLNDIDYFYFPSVDWPWQQETLELLGINSEKILSEVNVKSFTCDILVTTPFPRPEWDVPAWIPDALKSLFGAQASVCPLPHRRFYATRKDAKWRKVLNEDDLVKALSSVGFEILTLADFTLAEKIRLFSETAAVISMHGSSLGNTLFCRNGGGVLEMFGPGQISPLHRQIAECIPLKYKAIHLSGITSPESDFLEAAFCDVTVDIDRILVSARQHFQL